MGVFQRLACPMESAIFSTSTPNL